MTYHDLLATVVCSLGGCFAPYELVGCVHHTTMTALPVILRSRDTCVYVSVGRAVPVRVVGLLSSPISLRFDCRRHGRA